MKFLVKTRAPLLILGDLVIFYGSLLLTLLIRYRELNPETLSLHLPAFTIFAVLWVTIFFIGGLYDIKALRTSDYFYNHFLALIAVSAALMATLLYLVPAFGITPKMNLIIFVGLFTVLDYFWRIIFNGIISMSTPRTKMLIIGSNRSVEELISHLKENPHLGYEVSFWMRDGLQNKNAGDIKDLVQANRINLIVIPAHIKKTARAAHIIYQSLPLGVDVVNLADLYETVFQKVSLSELEEAWFLEHLPTRNPQYREARRAVELVLALIIGAIVLPIGLLAAILVPLTSAGPTLYVQKRVGKNHRVFNLYKFRSMYHAKEKNPDADASTPIWTTSGDDRVTPLGKILRWAHIDELPQLFNIFRGEMSFIGPRPERPEFTAQLEKEIPFYELRCLVRPGITGWAQISYPYGSSVEDAYEKLQYDIFYLKNQSVFLDIKILVKTIKHVFVPAKSKS